MAEDAQGAFDIAQCQQLSQDISPMLDVEEPISGPYHLEVSSPGIDRPLVRKSDFEQWSGHEVRVELTRMLQGRKRFRGIVKGMSGNQVILHLPDVPEGADPLVYLDLACVSRARLILTERLLEQAARNQKKDPLKDPEIETIVENESASEYQTSHSRETALAMPHSKENP